MKILFLDIEGVLVTDKHTDFLLKNLEPLPEFFQFIPDPICLDNLKEIIIETNCFIVITSMWRAFKTDRIKPHWKVLKKYFEKYEIWGRVIGTTPLTLHKSRQCEICQWIEENKGLYIDKFAILDDCRSMGSLNQYHFECDSSDGLTIDIKNLVVSFFNSGT